MYPAIRFFSAFVPVAELQAKRFFCHEVVHGRLRYGRLEVLRFLLLRAEETNAVVQSGVHALGTLELVVCFNKALCARTGRSPFFAS